MLPKFSDSDELLGHTKSEGLYHAILDQLNKDFTLANIDLQFGGNTPPKVLKKRLHEKLYVLLLERFSDYLNLMYVIDIPERAFKNIEPTDAVEVAEKVTFLLLGREWQKVWYKKQNKSS
ncbi:hypothetical protein [Flagellimonas lutaonensis]|uniref:Uncharacterized protein n=1 Tax=Flagellimonas lutaonensis TaxID=516051 RepID=A0A0D5YT64_9FLAO|nr:hypothetical protein [Allomuricauda lutaonensis]AKA35470.1 hypothetical protein VC82_1865 [Allomuricauda lutaonensis]